MATSQMLEQNSVELEDIEYAIELLHIENRGICLLGLALTFKKERLLHGFPGAIELLRNRHMLAGLFFLYFE